MIFYYFRAARYFNKADMVIFHHYWYRNRFKHEIKLDNVIKFYLVNYGDNFGEIYIFTKDSPGFVTRNFWSGSTRPTISLEDIDDAYRVFKIFQETLRSYPATRLKSS